MFHHIPWPSYWLTIVLLCAGYYLLVYLLYFRKDFRVWLPRKDIPLSSKDPSLAASLVADPSTTQGTLFRDEDTKDFPLTEEGSEERLVHSLLGEVNAFLEEARRSRSRQEELLPALALLLQKYPTLKTAPCLQSVSKVIATQLEHLCSLHLRADQVVRLWEAA